ncbi:MAG: hypothetical protein K6E79_04915 [Pseudobutyrivibrio sp.]|nr:hypothetical protein [Pseudobutyrivibrio sp.]
MDALNNYLQTSYATQSASATANATSAAVGKINSDSSEEEITEAVKSFETFMMEQVIKQMKETFTSDDDEDDTMSMYKDLYMDSAITEIASQLVDQLGDSVTDDFVQQIMRNYGITGTTSPTNENTDLDAEVVSDEIADTNSTTVTQVLA